MGKPNNIKLLAMKKVDELRHNRVTFICVEPTDLQETIVDIIFTLADLSWINRFDEKFKREALFERVIPTVEDIKAKLLSYSEDSTSNDAGEYVVSELSRSAIETHMKYKCTPLAELFNKQRLGNPGFDYYCENDYKILIFGEAKYLADRNAYGKGLKQIVDFIDEGKDIKDILDLELFFEVSVLNGAVEGKKGFAVGFASKNTDADKMIKRILKNNNYNKLLSYDEIILVAVNI